MRILYYQTASGRQPVRDYILDLPEVDRAAITGDLELIVEHGVAHASVETRKLQGYRGLWEIKTGTGNRHRVFYCLIDGPDIVLLHACKKQRQTQPRDVEIAARRMKEIIS